MILSRDALTRRLCVTIDLLSTTAAQTPADCEHIRALLEIAREDAAALRGEQCTRRAVTPRAVDRRPALRVVQGGLGG